MQYIDRPQAGYYRTRMCRGGPFVPARIWREVGQWFCTINGNSAEPLDAWPYLARYPIAKAAYVRMEHRRLWAERHQPWHWAANPRRALRPQDYGES